MRVLARAVAIAFAFCLGMAAGAQAHGPSSWRKVPAKDLLLIQTRYGQVAVELLPAFAPLHVARVRALTRAHFYDGLSFYRVIDGFVAQGGIGEGTAATKDHPKSARLLSRWPPLKAEFDAPIATIHAPFVPTGSPDLYAPEVGWVKGFPVGRDPKAGREWILNCPGTFAFARNNAPNSATTEFYIVIGEAPRRLDRNLSAFGRVIAGMKYLQKLHRGDPNVDHGVIADRAKRDPIVWMRMASQLPVSLRPRYEVLRDTSKAFARWKAARINPAPQFYVHQPRPILDVCLSPVPARRLKS